MCPTFSTSINLARAGGGCRERELLPGWRDAQGSFPTQCNLARLEATPASDQSGSILAYILDFVETSKKNQHKAVQVSAHRVLRKIPSKEEMRFERSRSEP
ncbi:hypothetical protein TWF694_005877 [Orbilia ellipsospora]|uniref:Uncharacterized protein n=1 Tax=Orbilia ellipsospora TaxID=2528407 RepID=A0AAV9WS71_9PEZI